MNTKHTPEPWSRESDGHGTETIFAHSIAIAACVRRNDAARIVACVNACAGIPLDELQAGKIIDRVSEAAADTLAERDQLRVQVADLSAQIDTLALGNLKAQHASSVRIIELTQREAKLRSALERAMNRLSLAFGNKPVRDVAETLAECLDALADGE